MNISLNVKSTNNLRRRGQRSIVGSPDETPGGVQPITLTISPASVVVGQAVHFKVSDASMTALASAVSLPVSDYASECEWEFEYSVGNAAENYAFESLPDHYIGPRAAGRALGKFTAHVYVTPGEHTVRAAVWRRGVKVGEGTTTITVAARSYAPANMGFVATTLPVAGADGVPAGATNVFTDFKTAVSWLIGGDNRALFLRRGQTFPMTEFIVGPVLRLNAMVGSYDASGPNPLGPTEPRPVVDIDFSDYGAPIRATAAAGQTVFSQSFTTKDNIPDKPYVYVDNVLQHPDLDYTFTRTYAAPWECTITFTTPLAGGEAVRVFKNGNSEKPGAGPRVSRAATAGEQVFSIPGLDINVRVLIDGVRLLDSAFTADAAAGTVTLDTPLAGGEWVTIYDKTSFGKLDSPNGQIFRYDDGSSGSIIRDIDFSGMGDPTAGGYFDPFDLTTADFSWQKDFLIGSASTGFESVTLFRCGTDGFDISVAGDETFGNLLAAVDCAFLNWMNFGVFTDDIERMILAGCQIEQSLFAAGGNQDKKSNTPITAVDNPLEALNAPWHGPVRLALCIEAVIQQCSIRSRNGWANGYLDAQPCLRLIQGTYPGQNFSLTHCYMDGGQGNFGGGRGAANQPWVPMGSCFIGYNVMVMYPPTEGASGGSPLMTTVSNLMLVPENSGGIVSLSWFRSEPGNETGLCEDDVGLTPWKSINDTLLVLGSRPAAFTVNNTYKFAEAGIMNVVSSLTPGGYIADASVYTVTAADLTFPYGPNTIRVPVISGGTMLYVAAKAPRIWRAAPGAPESSATAATLWADQVPLYDFQFNGGTLNDPKDRGVVTFTKDTGSTTNFVFITTKGAPWAEGDQIWLTMEDTHSTWFSDSAAPDIFSPNNRTNELIRPRADLYNMALIVDGDWTEVVVDGVSAPATAYRSTLYGSWDSYWRPQAGNTVIGASGTTRAAFDLFGNLRTGKAKGALEPDSAIAGQPPLPVRAPIVTLALAQPVYTEGDLFDTTDAVVTISEAGVPPLDPATIRKTAFVYDAGGALLHELVPGDAAVTLAAGQYVRAAIQWSHPLLTIQDAQTTQQQVATPVFSPEWVQAAYTLTSPYNGSRCLVTGLPATVDGVNQHIALRLRNYFSNTVQPNPIRPYWGSANGTNLTKEAYLNLYKTGDLRFVVSPSGFSPIIAVVPNTGGLASILVSAYFDGTGPTAYLPSGNGMIAYVQVNGGAVTPVVLTTTTPYRMFSEAYRVFSSVQGSGNVAFQQYLGLWLGGAPSWSDFFATDGTVQQWAADPTRGVPGMTLHHLLNGVGVAGATATFNGNLDAGALPWVVG